MKRDRYFENDNIMLKVVKLQNIQLRYVFIASVLIQVSVLHHISQVTIKLSKTTVVRMLFRWTWYVTWSNRNVCIPGSVSIRFRHIVYFADFVPSNVHEFTGDIFR